MRSLKRTLAFVMLLSSVLAAAESVRSLYNNAVKAEARQDYEAAYEFYKAAYDKKPDDLKYRLPYERVKFLAVASKVKRAQRLRDQGKLQDALQLFQKAAEIDPGNDLASQEVRRTRRMIQGQAPEGQAAPGAAPKAPEEDALRQRLEKAGGPIQLNPIDNVRIGLHLTENDSKKVYETICKIAGLNVLFDPEYQSRRLSSIDLDQVNLEDALNTVALETRTFWRPVTSNTIFVAQDSPTKRKELEQNVVKTFYLGNVATPTDLQDVVNAMRTILEVQKIQQIPSQNAIILRGTPDQVALAEKMVEDIDKSKPEVIVDVIVAQVQRDKIRNLGLVPPQNASVALQGANTTNTNNTTTPTNGGLDFNSLQHLNSASYAVSISPVTATALFSDNNTKIMQSPQIRASDGIIAHLKIGARIPVATGSFGTPLGVGTGVGLGVNTQFQYIDTGVVIDMTPRVHPDGEVSLKIKLEVTSQTGSATIGNVSQPIISQRSVDHEIRLKDGEMNLLGGIMEDTDTSNANGTPFLGQIPLLKYLFSQQNHERLTNEIVFLLIPHIVRGQEISDMNRRALDVGTGSSGISLHVIEPASPKPEGAARPPARPAATTSGNRARSAPQEAATQPDPTAQPSTGQSAAPPGAPAQAPQGLVVSQPAGQPTEKSAPGLSTQPTPAQPAAAQTNSLGQPASLAQPAAPAKPASGTPAGAPISFSIDPGTVTPAQGSSFVLNVTLAGGQDVYSVPAQITYDSKVLQFVNVSNGDFLAKDGQSVTLVHRDDPGSGKLQVTAQRPPGVAGVSGGGTVFNLVFTAKAKGTGVVILTAPGARNSQNQPLLTQGSQAAVTVN